MLLLCRCLLVRFAAGLVGGCAPRSRLLALRSDARCVSSDADVEEAAAVFAAAFFGADAAAAAVRADFDERYGDRGGLRRLPSALFAVGDPAFAVVGAELAIVDGARVYSNVAGEAWVNDRMGALGGRSRKQLAGLDAFGLVAKLAEPHERLRVAPVLSNLAVLPTRRRGGLAKQLVVRVEAWCRGVGAPEVLLVVNADNAAARGLYASCGFEVVEEFPSVALSTDDAGDLIERPTTDVIMRKRLDA
ncbi:hypothetical protein M885DRAFT_619804 [Pelagophyceae sp. CCMP2097]|nr:hypothetical protein M885DRAFT_619804 [Pelagophyceae sp. CCMP2097]